MLRKNPAHRVSAIQALAALVEAASGWDHAGKLVVQSCFICKAALAVGAVAPPNPP